MPNRLTNYVLIILLSAVTGFAPLIGYAEDPPIEDILANTSTRLDETESMAFKMELEGTTYVDGANSIQLLGAEGVMKRPDRVDVTFKALVLKSQQISIRMINIGDEAWITDIVTGKWVPSPPEFGYNVSVLFDDEDGLGPVMSRMNDPMVDGSEEIDGRDSWRIKATVDGEVISAMTSGTMRGSTQNLEIWVDKDTNDLLQIRISEPTDEDIDDPATWTLTFSKHNEDVEIEQPAND